MGPTQWVTLQRQPTHLLVGIVSQADVSRHLPDESIGQLVESTFRASFNN